MLANACSGAAACRNAPTVGLYILSVSQGLSTLQSFWRKLNPSCMQDAAVREAALDVLLQLYAAPANLSPLHVFTERFQQRFAELVRGALGSNLLLIH